MRNGSLPLKGTRWNITATGEEQVAMWAGLGC